MPSSENSRKHLETTQCRFKFWVVTNPIPHTQSYNEIMVGE